jgi:DNA-binding Xre family transcriptional regulator
MRGEKQLRTFSRTTERKPMEQDKDQKQRGQSQSLASSWYVCIREVAQAQGLDQVTLALRSGLSSRTIRKLWHHPEQDVRLSTLARIARVLGVKVTDLIETPEPSLADKEEEQGIFDHLT